MRVKKASINVFVNMLTFIIGMLPSFIITKVFIDTLGIELLGLTSLYTNIIGLLSIVELGIGSAIIYSLYKPFAENDQVKIKGYLNYYSRFYKIIGCVIFISGLFLLPFLNVFIKNDVSLLEAQIYFILFLLNTLLSYLFSYKLCILTVAQEGYKVAIATMLSKLVIAALQIAMFKLYPSIYGYICIQIVVNGVYYLLINIYINNKYKWINKTKGLIEEKERKSLTKNVKAIFLHKIGGMMVFGIDNLVISSFINLTVVGIFNSYNLVIGAAQGVISSALSGVTASVGNLLAEGNNDAYKVHKRLFFLSFWVVSFVTISLFNTLEQFVFLWLGKGQIMDHFTIQVLLINFYFMLMRASVERFKEGGGIYHQDRFAPLFEATIKLVASVLLVKAIGLPGVFLGTLISNVGIIFWVKPRMVYKYIFNMRLIDYFKMYFKFLLVAVIPLVITSILTMSLKENISIVALSANCLINIVVINFIYLIVLRNNEEFLYFKKLLLSFVAKPKPLVMEK
ncbi:lipopolysaccharide biosynthesis protein [Paenibacillus eucommiae]|uniref:O-antigen/teichoic acid export membrane protein n=1 Tax=Paenibacillus eucommiae TaxID=1355755 RepID=A0ABS4IS30_9BACL|nr:oligosaccharide flippase family protein [Paenibacillus eucommiae]MBP1990377.1 O-antigen/teichoic acid export membrane protein [Paenibacillus eucommiae]